MMNASFRTAFWAMCLGLTVPMTLFVGVELTSGGRAPANRRNAAAMASGSLQSRWSIRPGPAGVSPDPADRPHPHAKSVDKRDAARRSRQREGATLGPLIEPDDAIQDGNEIGPQVVLGPQLESDPSATDEPVSFGTRLAATPTGVRPRAEIVPNEIRSAQRPASSRIETQLDEILGQLDRLATSVSNRQPASDPMQQAVELLKRLQQARLIQEQAARVPEISAPEVPAERPVAPVESPATLQTAPAPASEGSAEPIELPAPSTPVPVPAPAAPGPPAAQSKIFRPRYIAVRALESLVTPLLTAGVGRVGAASNENENAAGDLHGQLPTQWDALVVRDTPDVLRKIDRLIRELDVPPEKVLIETTVVTVRLHPNLPYGIDLGEFNISGQPFAIQPADLKSADVKSLGASTGAGREPILAASIPTLTHGAGIKCGVLRGDARAFLQVLQTAHHLRGCTASQATLANKQTTEILLGDGFAAAVDGVRPFSAGTILRVRPIVTRDRLIHLDVRPVFGAEAPSWADGATIREGGLGNQLTLRLGETAVVSGLIADHIISYSYNKSAAGELPIVGHWFRGQAGMIQRSETIVLLTPHLAESQTSTAGTAFSGEPARRRQVRKPAAEIEPTRLVDVRVAEPATTKPGRDSMSLRQTGRPISKIRQAAASSSRDETTAKKKPRAATGKPRVARKADDLLEIPEIPAEKVEPQRPLIRPATSR